MSQVDLVFGGSCTTWYNWKTSMGDNTRRPVLEIEEDSHRELQNTSKSLGLEDVLWTSALDLARSATFPIHLCK